jgi:hypothetical protein
MMRFKKNKDIETRIETQYRVKLWRGPWHNKSTGWMNTLQKTYYCYRYSDGLQSAPGGLKSMVAVTHQYKLKNGRYEYVGVKK